MRQLLLRGGCVGSGVRWCRAGAQPPAASRRGILALRGSPRCVCGGALRTVQGASPPRSPCSSGPLPMGELRDPEPRCLAVGLGAVVAL